MTLRLYEVTGPGAAICMAVVCASSPKRALTLARKAHPRDFGVGSTANLIKADKPGVLVACIE